MRASAKWIMFAVALAFVGWMVFDVGMDVGGRGGGAVSNVVLHVNGNKVDYQTFYGRVRLAQEQQRSNGAALTTLDELRDLEDQVVQSFVQAYALADEYSRRGITVSDREIADAMRNQPLPEFIQEPTFQTDGQFDLAKYQRYLEAAGTDFQLAIQARYQEELPRIKLYERLVGDVFLSDHQLWTIYQDENDSVAVRIVTILPQAVVSDTEVDVTDAEIAAYYNEHREDYERPAVAYTSFAKVSRIPSATDSAAALVRAREILAELRAGADFAEVAARESSDSVSRQNGGDLGEAARGQHVTAFTEAALALRPGQISEPVLTDFGYHIIKLHSKGADTYHASHILISVELEGDHLVAVESRGDSLDMYAAEQEDPTALDSVASTLGIPVRTADPLVEGSGLRVDGYFVPDVAVWAFDALEGETSHVIESERAYYVFRLDSLKPAGVRPLGEVRESVTFEATLARKWEKAEELAAAVKEDLDGGLSLEAAAEKHGLTATDLPMFSRQSPSPALGDAPRTAGAAFGLEVGETGGPIRSQHALFFVQPTDRQEADSSAFAAGIDAYRDRILMAARSARVQLALSAIIENAEVDDLRREVAQALRRAPETGLPGSPLGF
ncbi:MAG: peptidyl-prolyl cis-trans isomerase [Gemmatimonadales bacterium]